MDLFSAIGYQRVRPSETKSTVPIQMKLIIHIGPPKTGTTALQRALFNARKALLDQKVLYPDPKVRKAYNHGSLCYLFRPFSEAPRGMKKKGEAHYIKQGKALRREVEEQTKEARPDVLILSSEWFARAYQATNTKEFVAFAEGLGASSIEFVLYARRPSEFFLSASQQRLRASSIFQPIYPWNVNGLINGFRSLAGQHQVTALSFDRKALKDGNIVADFATRYIPSCLDLLKNAKRERQSNESFSAESMVILQDFRRSFFAEQEEVFNERTRKLMRKLQKFDARDGNPRPKLKPEWKDFLDYGDERALDLRDTHQIAFSNFDYARLENGDFALRPDKSDDVADIVTVDAERVRQLIGDLEQSNWSLRRRSDYWLRQLSQKMGRTTAGRSVWRRIF
jgi:hypothetical protein